MPPDTRRQIDKMAQQGHTQSAIARALGIERHTVSRHLAGPVAEPMPAAPPGLSDLTPLQIAKMQYLAAGLRHRPCPAPNCGRAMYDPPLATAGTCLWCGGHWQDVASVQPPAGRGSDRLRR